MTTGWFGVPRAVGEPSVKATKVHFVHADNRRTLCGITPKGEYQFCAAGCVLLYVECAKCYRQFKRPAVRPEGLDQ